MNNAQIVATGGQAAQGLQYRAIFTSFLVKCPFKYRNDSKSYGGKNDFEPKITQLILTISMLIPLNRLKEYNLNRIKR